MNTPPKTIHDPAEKAKLYAKVKRIAGDAAVAPITIPIGPGGGTWTTLTIERGDAAELRVKAEADAVAQLDAWYAQWPEELCAEPDEHHRPKAAEG